MNIKIFDSLLWIITGCKMHVGIATAAAVVGAAATVAGTAMSATAGGGGIKGPSQQAINDAIAPQQTALVNTINLSDAALKEQERLQKEAYSRTQGYQQPYQDVGAVGNQQILDYMGRPAQQARAASGTPPAELARLQSDVQSKQTALDKANASVSEFKSMLGKLQWSPSNAATIQQAQAAYNQTVRARDAAQAQFDSVNNAFQQAQATPYQAAQEARDAVPGQAQQTFATPTNQAAAYDYTISRNQNVTNDQINKWLQDNPGLNDEQIMQGMRDNGISTQQIASATGIPIDEITKRVQSVTTQLNPYNQRAVPTYTAYGEPIPQFTGYKPPPEFTSYDKAIPEYKALTYEQMVANDPGYQARLDQQNRVLQNKALGAGKFFSGNTAEALSKFGQDYASSEFGAADQRNTNNFLQGLTQWQTGSNQNNSDFTNNLAQWGQGFNQNSSDYLNNLKQWGLGYDKNNNDFVQSSNSWINDYNSFVNDQDRLFGKLTGLSGIGQQSAGALSNAAGNYADSTSGYVGQNAATQSGAWQNLADTVSGTLTGADSQNRDAAAQKGIIKGNAITSGTENLLTSLGTLSGGYGGNNKIGSSSTNLNSNRAPQSYLPTVSSAGGFWGGNTLANYAYN